MRITLTVAATLLLWMCESDPPVMPPAEHGGVVVAVGAQPLEVVAHTDGQITAYPLATSTVRGPSASVIVHVPGVDGVVHDAPLVWDEPSATYLGTITVAPQVGPIEIDAVVAGAPVHASAPVFVVLAPVTPVVVGTAPVTVGVGAPPRPGAHVEVVTPRPGVVVEVPPPHPAVVVEVPPPPRPGVVVAVPPAPPPVLLVPPPPPGPPGVVIVGPAPPRPGVVIVGDRDGRVDEGRGHWDHGRHGGRGPEWHGGGGGHGRH